MALFMDVHTLDGALRAHAPRGVGSCGIHVA
jgi:hypothetical protein